MQRVSVSLGVYTHRGDTHLLAGSDDTHRDLAAIGYEDFLEDGRDSFAPTFGLEGQP
jgi:hypothetical protein